MMRILLCLLSPHKSCCRRTVVTIGDIETWHLGELCRDGCDVLVVAHDPELMTEAIDRCDEIILRSGCCIAHQEFVEHGIVRICEEDRFDVGIAYTHVLHAVFLLVTASQLMLLDDSREIVVDVCAHHKTILRLAVHGLRIDVILLLVILLQPSFVLELLEVLGSTLIDTRIVLRRAWLKVDFRFDDMIKALFVVASFCTSFLRVEDVVRTRLHLLYEVFGRSYPLERFYCCHNILLSTSLCVKKRNFEI